ncbi:hypothetical protein [Pelagibacterium lentulum]|uniref:Uncharacterized protein n=1 Tax=Pelagibacterium lentulum TaxID=2029865 RepID=A0A916RMZ8_9HYPH|nr:hypothetical protein [Pelagibacterium lentulum]GGA62444.1 hypothetical protein GCM10011499_36020 [Pelagibacterium lentulum]
MFAFQSGEPLDVSRAKTRLRTNARKQWPFLTPLDLTMIDSEYKLVTMVQDRSGITNSQSQSDVQAWMQRQGKPASAPATDAQDVHLSKRHKKAPSAPDLKV